jgi:hypothetical protein
MTNGDQNLLQLRFSGDLLMELGAGIELATAAFPQLFLPMACIANVVKVCPTKLSQQVPALLSNSNLPLPAKVGMKYVLFI